MPPVRVSVPSERGCGARGEKAKPYRTIELFQSPLSGDVARACNTDPKFTKGFEFQSPLSGDVARAQEAMNMVNRVYKFQSPLGGAVARASAYLAKTGRPEFQSPLSGVSFA